VMPVAPFRNTLAVDELMYDAAVRPDDDTDTPVAPVSEAMPFDALMRALPMLDAEMTMPLAALTVTVLAGADSVASALLDDTVSAPFMLFMKTAPFDAVSVVPVAPSTVTDDSDDDTVTEPAVALMNVPSLPLTDVDDDDVSDEEPDAVSVTGPLTELMTVDDVNAAAAPVDVAVSAPFTDDTDDDAPSD
jgi:hypothetical protein